MNPVKKTNRRAWLASVAMGVGLLASYGVLAVQGLLFLLPRQVGAKTRRLFVGQLSQFEVGRVHRVFDLAGSEILIRRNANGDFSAFSATCPHLGCKVRWEEEEGRYFCPCHSGVFSADGVAVSGPPADGGQNLIPVPLRIDEDAGILYVEVRDQKRGRS
jgi:Rieske Fe-S protein